VTASLDAHRLTTGGSILNLSHFPTSTFTTIGF
jgi:hypothetical protein